VAGQGRDTVKVNDIVVEIETAKSLVELPIPYAGIVSELLAEPGTTVDVGSPIITVRTGPGGQPLPDAATVQTPPDEGAVEPGLIGGPAPGGRTSVLVGYGPRTTEAKRRPRKGAAVPDSVATSVAQASVQSSFATVGVKSPEVPAHEAEPAIPPAVPEPDLSAVPVADAGSPLQVRALAKPPVRKLAKDRGIDLRAVTPTGPGGVITRADVEGHRAERVDDRERAERSAAQQPLAGTRRRAHPGPGCPQDDCRGDGRLRVHGPARH
jgi:pyruvate dehydrogenase E2 component (dihydrolipoamide acetyltransferase)